MSKKHTIISIIMVILIVTLSLLGKQMTTSQLSSGLGGIEIISDIGIIVTMISMCIYLASESKMWPIVKKVLWGWDIPRLNLSNINADDKVMKNLSFLSSFLSNHKLYNKSNGPIPKGVVLYGSSKAEQALVAKAIAGQANVPLLKILRHDFIEMYKDNTNNNMRKVFSKAKKKKPCVILIDGMDVVKEKLGTKEYNSPKYKKHREIEGQLVRSLLKALHEFKNEPVVMIIATHKVSKLDKSLIQSGQFDNHIYIKLEKELDVDVEEKKPKTKRKRTRKVRNHKNKKEIELSAYHEAGHALAVKLLTNNTIPEITITSNDSLNNIAIHKENESLTKHELINNIKILYAGRAAEFILRKGEGPISQKSSEDIRVATDYIKDYFYMYGTGEFGMAIMESEKLYNEKAVEFSNELFRNAVYLLKDNENKLKNAVKVLITNKTLLDKDLDIIMDNK